MKKHDGAVFSELTYTMLGSNSKASNIQSMNEKLQEEGLGNWSVSPNLSGRDISTFVNETTKEVVIAHRGTDTSGKKTKQDVSSDVLLGLGKVTAGFFSSILDVLILTNSGISSSDSGSSSSHVALLMKSLRLEALSALCPDHVEDNLSQCLSIIR